MYKLTFYVPSEEAEKVKEALFQKGAGKVGNYDRACWQVSGTGQFRPLEGSNPALGSVGDIHQEEELRVEMLLEEEKADDVIAALKMAHPYEEPAWDLVRIIRW